MQTKLFRFCFVVDFVWTRSSWHYNFSEMKDEVENDEPMSTADPDRFSHAACAERVQIQTV